MAPKKLLHQADAVFRGFRYQLLQSLLTWLSLREGEELCIEISEDFSRASSDAITDVQVKSSTAKDLPRYSLQTGDVKAALLRYWERSGGGLDPLPQLVFLAHGGEAKEQGLPLLPGGLSGIGYWRAAAADADVGPMRALLLAVFADTPIGAWLGSEPSDQELRDRLLRRVTWALNAPSAEGLEALVRDQITAFYLSKRMLLSNVLTGIAVLLNELFEVAGGLSHRIAG